MKKLSVLVLLFALSWHLPAQVISMPSGKQIQWAGVDRAGDLFVILDNGDVTKYNKEGSKIGSHSLGAVPTLFEPMDGAQSFYYQTEGQTYGNLSSDLTSATRHTVDPSFAINPKLVCPSLHELWILDGADFSLKKTKLNSMTIFLESALKHLPTQKISDFIYMREYQNYLFLLDKQTGVHMFNSLGKYVRTFGTANLSYFNFLGEEIYYLENGQLTFVDLYTQEKRSIKLQEPCTFALVNDDRIYMVSSGKVSILPFKPGE